MPVPKLEFLPKPPNQRTICKSNLVLILWARPVQREQSTSVPQRRFPILFDQFCKHMKTSFFVVENTAQVGSFSYLSGVI